MAKQQYTMQDELTITMTREQWLDVRLATNAMQGIYNDKAFAEQTDEIDRATCLRLSRAYSRIWDIVAKAMGDA
jgi:hypothetical protein